MKLAPIITASLIGLSHQAGAEELCSPEVKGYINNPHTVCEADTIRTEVGLVVGSILGMGMGSYIYRRRRRDDDRIRQIFLSDVTDKKERTSPKTQDALLRESIGYLQSGDRESSMRVLEHALDLSGHHDKALYISYLQILYELCLHEPTTAHKKEYFIFFHRTCMHFRQHTVPDIGHKNETSLTQNEFEEIRNWGRNIDPENHLYDAATLEELFHPRRYPLLPTLTEELSSGETIPATLPPILPGEGETSEMERQEILTLLSTLETQDASGEKNDILGKIDALARYYKKAPAGLKERIRLTLLGLERIRTYDYSSYGMKRLGFSEAESTRERVIALVERRKIEIAEEGTYRLGMINRDVHLTLAILISTTEGADFSYARDFIRLIDRYCGTNKRLFQVFRKSLEKKGKMAERLFDIQLALLPFKDQS